MTEAPPTLLRVDGLTLFAGLEPHQHVTRARDGRRACVVGDGGAHVWALDLPEARVLTQIPVPTGVAAKWLLDDARLLVHDRAGFLRVFALPDGGEVACLRAPVPRPAHAHAADWMALPGDAEIALRDGVLEVEREGPLFALVDLRDGSCREVSARRVVEALMADPWQRQTLARWPDGPVDPWPEFAPDGERLAVTLELPPNPRAPHDAPDWTRVVTLRSDDPETTLAVWPGALEGYSMYWRGADALGGYVPVRTGPRPYTACPFAVRRVFRDKPAQTWHPTAPFTVRDGVVALGFVLHDGDLLAVFSGPRRAVTLRPGPHGDVVTDALAGESPDALHATRPVLIHAWGDGGVALALPRPNGDTDLVARGARVATLPAAYGHPQALHVPDGSIELLHVTEGAHRVNHAVWLPPDAGA
ncbi:MAG: hypothetical protein U0325_12270 [Polyangiales bacterium]